MILKLLQELNQVNQYVEMLEHELEKNLHDAEEVSDICFLYTVLIIIYSVDIVSS